MTTLLLNETSSGQRFWNLLRLSYVEGLAGEVFVLGVLTRLSTAMPAKLAHGKGMQQSDLVLKEQEIKNFTKYIRTLREQARSGNRFAPETFFEFLSNSLCSRFLFAE